MKTVLVVDDEKDIRDALSAVLDDEGYTVASAGSSEEAMKKLEAGPAEIVLLDIWLPGMDGIEALKEMKKRHPEIPVIMISGHASIETAVKATKLGAYDFIEKPLSLDKVIITVEHALEQKRLMEENSALRQKALSKFGIIGVSGSMEALKKRSEEHTSELQSQFHLVC